MATRKPAPWYRELFKGPILEPMVRGRFARRVVGWLLVPMWIATAIAVPVGVVTARAEPLGRIAPAVVMIAGLSIVTYFRIKLRFVRAAAALSGTMFATIASAVMFNSLHAPMYQGGFVLLALAVSLFGTRWALAVALALVGVGALSIALHAAGLTYPIPDVPTGVRLVMYSVVLLLALVVLGGMQRLLAEALAEARRKHREAITARKAEAASELAFHAVFDQASVGMLLLTPHGRIAEVNARAARLLGAAADPNALLGQALDAAPPWNESQRTLLVEAARLAADGGGSRHELSVRGKHGVEHVYQVNLSPFHAEDGTVGHVLVEIVEVTDLVRTRTLLAQARRLEALGKLSGGVAHDINNMLAAIQGASDLLRPSPDAGQLDLSRDIIQASVVRASSLTKQLLAFGRQDRFESVDIDVHRLVSDLGRLFERTLHKNIAIAIQPSDEPATVRGDPAALENALLNLALNAQDAMPNGGTLAVTTRVAELDDVACAELGSDLRPGSYVVIEVSDTGSGMTDTVRERMFEPFFTTKPPGKGAGLGLAAVHGTVRNHHGAIAVRTEEGAGSTLELYLPAVEPRHAGATVREERPSALWLRARVLVADDEPLVREALVALLESAGCTVQVADSGEALVEALASGAVVDAIVTDLMMPGLSGAKLVEALEATVPGCPMLLITGFTGEDVTAALGGRSNYRLLRKPTTRAELIRALQELLPEQADERPLEAQTA